MGNPFGRSNIVPLTNKSGGSVAAGDLVYIDTANNDAFTTGTTSAYTKGIGIAQATIASNAIGLVLIDGYAALVNVNASVTRGNFLKGYTVVKQGTDAGSSRASGTCGMFLTGGTTPDAIIWQPDLGAGSGLTDPMTTRGDIIYRDASNVTNRLAIPAAGQVLGRSGSDLGAVYPPGYELDYVQITSNVAISATTEGTATTVITSSSVTYDGAAVLITFYGLLRTGATAGHDMTVYLRDDTAGAVIGTLAYMVSPAANFNYAATTLQRRMTPAAGARVYSLRAASGSGDGQVAAGAGGSGSTEYPAFLRITKV